MHQLGSWEANVGFGDHEYTEVWYKKVPEAEKVFIHDLKTVLTTIMTSHGSLCVCLGEPNI
jgi:hypothetical protein